MHYLDFNFPPEPKLRPIFSSAARTARTPRKTREYEHAVATAARRQWRGPPLQGPLLLELDFFLAKPKRPKHPLHIVRPDVDNLAKAIKDALNGIVWVDDSQVVTLIARKRYCYLGLSPRTRVMIEVIT